MPATYRGRLRRFRANAWARTQHQSFRLFFWWAWQMTMALTGIWAFVFLHKPNKFQGMGPGGTDFSPQRDYYIQHENTQKSKSVHSVLLGWSTMLLCAATFAIALGQQVLSLFNRLSKLQLKMCEWMKSILWFIWFWYIGIEALAMHIKVRSARELDRIDVHETPWPRIRLEEQSFPNASNVISAIFWGLPFWSALPIMWLVLRKGTFDKHGNEQIPVIRVDGADDITAEDWHVARERRGYDGAYESIELIQPSQRSLEEVHPAYASTL